MTKKLKRMGSFIGNWLLGLLYPDTCPFCGKIFTKGICERCRQEIVYISEPRCMKCGKPISNKTEEYCYDCQGRQHNYERGVSLWLHKGKVQQSIYQFKYHNRKIYGSYFGKELASQYGDLLELWRISLIIPIPISKKRRKNRGFNQADIIAESLGKEMHIPVDKKHLVRIKDTLPQKHKNARERRENLRNAFKWNARNISLGNVLLVDDIYTTGSTIDSATDILKQAGAHNVYFLTISIGQGN